MTVASNRAVPPSSGHEHGAARSPRTCNGRDIKTEPVSAPASTSPLGRRSPEMATSRSQWSRTADTCTAADQVLSGNGGDADEIVPERQPAQLVPDFRFDAGASRNLASTGTGSYSSSALRRTGGRALEMPVPNLRQVSETIGVAVNRGCRESVGIEQISVTLCARRRSSGGVHESCFGPPGGSFQIEMRGWGGLNGSEESDHAPSKEVGPDEGGPNHDGRAPLQTDPGLESGHLVLC
jgi:hypothetical protein